MIHLEKVNKYFGDNHVLKDISLDVKEGEKIVIIGPSGSGKSTLIRCMNRLEEVTSGVCKVYNVDLSEKKAPIQKVRQKVAMVFQNFNLYSHKSVLENVAMGPTILKGVRKSDAEKSAMDYLDRVGLVDKANSYPAQLSGGQKQRVAIARALNMRPEVILFDEPTSALDPEMIQEVLEVMTQLAEENITMVTVTHEMGFARKAADRVIFMDKGEIIESAAPDIFFDQTQNTRVQNFLNKIIAY